MDPQQLLMAYMERAATYHDHKERMAYAATTLYLAGASVWLLQESFWTQLAGLKLVFVVVVVVFATLLVSLFVDWQLRMRLEAAVVVGACRNISAQWLAAPTQAPIAARETRNYMWPAPLADEIDRIEPRLRRQISTPLALTHLALVVWGVMLLVRAVAACQAP